MQPTKQVQGQQLPAAVYCPLCTHTVEVQVTVIGRRAKVTPGQTCPHCSASIDAGYVFEVRRAA
jgi:hypothetical protein